MSSAGLSFTAALRGPPHRHGEQWIIQDDAQDISAGCVKSGSHSTFRDAVDLVAQDFTMYFPCELP